MSTELRFWLAMLLFTIALLLADELRWRFHMVRRTNRLLARWDRMIAAVLSRSDSYDHPALAEPGYIDFDLVEDVKIEAPMYRRVVARRLYEQGGQHEKDT